MIESNLSNKKSIKSAHPKIESLDAKKDKEVKEERKQVAQNLQAQPQPQPQK